MSTLFPPPPRSLSERKETARIAGLDCQIQAKTRHKLAENCQIWQSGEAKRHFFKSLRQPARLYKYQPVYEDPDKNYSLRNLREQKLWVSMPESFNDPFDCSINFDIIDAKDEKIQFLFVRLLDL